MNQPMKWASLHNHSYFSLLDGLSSPEELIETAIKNNLSAISLTDHGSASGLMKFFKAKKKIQDKLKGTQWEDASKAIKLCLGVEFYIKVDDKTNSHLVILAKNLAGYKTLVKMTSEATRPENKWRKPRLSISQIADLNKDKNLFSFSAHPGSDLGNIVFTDLKGAYNATTEAEARTFINPNCKKDLLNKADEYIQAFGKDNFALEIQLFDANRMPAQIVIAKAMRWLAKETGLRCVPTCDSHYCREEQSQDQRILLCSALKTTLPKVYKQIASDEDDAPLAGFFKSSKYYLPTAEEMYKLHPEDEIKYGLEIAESIEEYDITSKPIIPAFSCPDGLTSDQYMTELCRQGWKEKLSFGSKEEKELYADRVKKELGVLQSAGLSDYFLIVQDIMNWTKSQGYMVGPGRGSAAGCLVSYLLGITSIDSIKYDLLFERFYNSGRNAPGRISLPDIDCDVQANCREYVINYIKDKYGSKKVGQLSNFGRLQGRACLKDVLRAHEVCDFTTMNAICKNIPDEAAIADELQEMVEEGREKSILLWTLQNNKKELSEWASLTDDGKIVGPLGTYFEQACRLEGTYRQIGKHAAAVVVFPEDIEDSLPVIYDKDNNITIAWDMHDTEAAGGVKFDILGITIADRIADAEKSIQTEFLLED